MLILDCNLRERRKFKSSSLSFHNGLKCVECTYKRCYLRITLLVIFNIIQYILAHRAGYRKSSDYEVFSFTIEYYKYWDIKPINTKIERYTDLVIPLWAIKGMHCICLRCFTVAIQTKESIT